MAWESNSRTALLCLSLLCLRTTGAEVSTNAVTELSPPDLTTPRVEGSIDLLPNILQVETFKKFLSSPPPIANVIFSERMPPDPQKPWRTDIPLQTSKQFRFWHGMWDPTGYFLREIPPGGSVTNLKTPGLLAASMDGLCTFHYGRGYNEEFVDVGAAADVCDVAKLNSAELRQVLTMGLMHSEISSIQWNGNNFKVLHTTQEVEIRGSINKNLSDQVDSMKVSYTTDKGDVNWNLRYEYGSAELNSNKTVLRISCFWVKNGEEVERSEFDLYHLESEPNRSFADYLKPDAYIKGNFWQEHVYTNNAVYSLLANGDLKLLMKNGKSLVPARRPGEATGMDYGLTYSLWGAANIGIFILGVGMNVKQNQPKGKQ